MTKDEKIEIAREAYLDPVFFCKFFLPHVFTREIPWFHRGLLAVLTKQTAFLEKYGDVDKIERNFVVQRAGKPVERLFYRDAQGVLQLHRARNTLIMLHRGGSKTTIAGLAMTLRELHYQDLDFMVYVSEAGPHAERQLANVAKELEENKQLHAIFGAKKDKNCIWRTDMIETVDKVAIMARGRGGQVRGLNYRSRRPKRILFDDLEDKESVSTAEQRKKVREWAFGDLMPAISELDNDSEIIGLGTLLHPEALLEVLARDPQWTVVKLGAVDIDGASIWPEQLSLEKLEAKKESASLAGELDLFYMEYYNEYRSPETQLFREDFFHVVPEPDLKGFYVAIYFDPAITEKVSSDTSVIAVVAMSPQGRIYVLETWGVKSANPRVMIDKYFELFAKWRAKCESITCGIEAIAFQTVFTHLMREEMFRKKLYFEIKEIKHVRKKTERIKGILQPRYAAGYIYHCGDFPQLKTQLLDFPRAGTHDDFPDALAGAVALLDPYAASAAGEFDLAADAYATTLDEEIGDDWRVA